MRKITKVSGIIALTSSLIFFSMPLGVAAVNAPGSKCTKVGATAKSGTISVKCVKSGLKLIWKKVVVAPKPSTAPTTPVAYEVNVNAVQWAWKFSYSKAGTTENLTDAAPSNPPVLYIPQGETVRFNLKSTDVLHGFAIPGLMVDLKSTQIGVAAQLKFTATKVGTYPGLCSVVCGREHSTQIFTVKVVTPAEFLTYLSTLKTG